jgi:hypothetical protein
MKWSKEKRQKENMHNVEGDNNRLTPGLQQLMGCVQNRFFFSFRFLKCFFYTGNYFKGVIRNRR